MWCVCVALASATAAAASSPNDSQQNKTHKNSICGNLMASHFRPKKTYIYSKLVKKNSRMTNYIKIKKNDRFLPPNGGPDKGDLFER